MYWDAISRLFIRCIVISMVRDEEAGRHHSGELLISIASDMMIDDTCLIDIIHNSHIYGIRHSAHSMPGDVIHVYALCTA